jgi:RecB family exonuclease
MNRKTITVVSTEERTPENNLLQLSALKLSATRIKMYRTCPRQYRYAYVEQIPTALTGPLAFGQVIHQILHTLHNLAILSGEPMDAARAFHDFRRLWQEIIHEHDPVFCGGDREIEEYSRLAGVILKNYVAAQSRDAAPSKAMPLVMEHPFEIGWQNGANKQEYRLCGVIDRIDQGTGGLIVVDYKTGKRRPAPGGLQSDLQLILYAYATQAVFGQPVEQVVLHHLRSNGRFTAQYGDHEFGYLFEEILPHVIRGIEEQRFAPRYGYWCNYCDFKPICEAEGNAATGIHAVSPQRAVPTEGAILRSQHRAIHALRRQVGMNEEQLTQLVKIRFGASRLEEITKRQAGQLLSELQRRRQAAPTR